MYSGNRNMALYPTIAGRGIGARNPAYYPQLAGRARIGEIMSRGRTARRMGIGALGVSDPCLTPAPMACPPTVPVCDTSSRRYFQGFSQDAVAANTQVLITARPQYLVRFDRLVIPSNIGQFFDLNNLTIGNVNQSVAAGANSGVVFSEVATYVELGLDTAYPGIDIVLTVTNVDAQPRNFRATLFGVLVA